MRQRIGEARQNIDEPTGPAGSPVDPAWHRGCFFSSVPVVSKPAGEIAPAPHRRSLTRIGHETRAPDDRYLVTAIVSAYRSERLMVGLLEDLEAQTIAERLEIVVCDSASPEDEAGIVREFARRYDNSVS